MKEAAEKIGELPARNIIDIYFNEICNIKGVFKLIKFDHLGEGKFVLEFDYKNKNYKMTGSGNGPIDACMDALKQAGFERKLLYYKQIAMDEELLGSGANAMSVIHIEGDDGSKIIGRAIHRNTAVANVKAIFNAYNLIYKG